MMLKFYFFILWRSFHCLYFQDEYAKHLIWTLFCLQKNVQETENVSAGATGVQMDREEVNTGTVLVRSTCAELSYGICVIGT